MWGGGWVVGRDAAVKMSHVYGLSCTAALGQAQAVRPAYSYTVLLNYTITALSYTALGQTRVVKASLW